MRQKSAPKMRRNANKLAADIISPCDGADRNVRLLDDDTASIGNIECIDASGLSLSDLDELQQQLELRRLRLEQQKRDSAVADSSDTQKTSVDAHCDVLTGSSTDEQHAGFPLTNANILALVSGSEAEISVDGNSHHKPLRKESGITFFLLESIDL
jgi:hypothetical protein